MHLKESIMTENMFLQELPDELPLMQRFADFFD